MSQALIALVLFMAGARPGNPDQTVKPTEVEALCGSLVHIDRIYDKHHPDRIAKQKEKKLAATPIRLYRWKSESICCDGAAPVAETVTGRLGRFEFKNVNAGDYWLVAETSGREYKLHVSYQPSKGAAGLCPIYQYEINDAGDFGLSVIITVD